MAKSCFLWSLDFKVSRQANYLGGQVIVYYSNKSLQLKYNFDFG